MPPVPSALASPAYMPNILLPLSARLLSVLSAAGANLLAGPQLSRFARPTRHEMPDLFDRQLTRELSSPAPSSPVRATRRGSAAPLPHWARRSADARTVISTSIAPIPAAHGNRSVLYVYDTVPVVHGLLAFSPHYPGGARHDTVPVVHAFRTSCERSPRIFHVSTDLPRVCSRSLPVAGSRIGFTPDR